MLRLLLGYATLAQRFEGCGFQVYYELQLSVKEISRRNHLLEDFLIPVRLATILKLEICWPAIAYRFTSPPLGCVTILHCIVNKIRWASD